MPQYSNSEIPEHINVSRGSPIKDFIKLSLGLLAILAGLAYFLAVSANWLAPKIPYRWEKSWGTAVEGLFREELGEEKENPQRAYLQSKVDLIAQLQNIPESMAIEVHYIESDLVNAFATLGGHIIVTSALLDKVSHENGLFMVLAHEVAHIKYRHPIQAVGRGVLFSIASSAIIGQQKSESLSSLIWGAGTLTLMSFSRDQEEQADHEALKTVYDHYGHTSGAFNFFEYLAEAEQGASEEGGKEAREIPVFLSTHPNTRERLANLKNIVIENRWQASLAEPVKVETLPSFD
ncbi:MAG: hypothetical protein COB51_08710 [Moraxellaceae bacterium]|nr:MAG: hypothetical protein COB51_08710 [Moraxellaceae bacterium]